MAVIPVIPNVPIKLSSIAEIARANLPLSNLMPGETLSVSVIDKLAPNQYLMTVKDGSMKATSDIPLNVGEKIQVRVQSVQPQIIFNVIDTQKQSTDAKVNEKLLQWRINPDSFTQLLSKVSEFSANLKLVNLPGLSPKDADGLLKLFSSLVFSSQSKKNPLFVKEFVSRSGLLLESDLNRIVLNPLKDGSTPVITDNLKASLLKLSETLTQVLKDGPKLDAQVAARLMNLSVFTSEAIQTIEARQAVNFIYQQNESGLYLQIPLAQGEVLRQADIFITPDDKNAAGAKKYSSCSIVIFLDLDYLGEISIDASVREGRIRCVIKCESEEVTQLVSASVQKLKEALSGIGYGVEHIDCLMVSELGHKRVEYVEQQLLGSTQLVNYFV